jgi:hypothetical protein
MSRVLSADNIGQRDRKTFVNLSGKLVQIEEAG